MKYLVILSVFASSLFSTLVNAGADDPVDKRFSVGLGTYSTVITNNDPYFDDDELSGLAISLSYAVSDIFALRGNFFSLEHDDFSDIESNGFDFLGHVGLNMGSPGFKAYIGGGFFRDKWEYASFDESFSGLQLSGGIGYNWSQVALDFIINIRDASDYEDFINSVSSNVDVAAASGSLLLSFRF